jgi:putative NIF3 family GTP cyclohydrolase 1 type 2
LANHKRFDELLTTGYNIALASRLGIQVERSVCLQGYKGDPDRRIGIVGPLFTNQTLSSMQNATEAEVGAAEAFETTSESLQPVQAVAIMNAFGTDEVARALTAAQGGGLLAGGNASGLLYITGQPRELGLQAATKLGMPVVCVGHRPCEEWGIRYLANLLQQSWAELAVHIVMEDETPPTAKAIVNTSVSDTPAI